MKLIQPKILALLVLTLFLNVKSYTQNNVLVLDGAYIVLDGGTAANSMYVVIDSLLTKGLFD